MQRAARRRKAIAVDSDKWYAEILRRRIERQAQRPAEEGQSKPTGPPSQREIEFWVRQFEQQNVGPSRESDRKQDPTPDGAPSQPPTAEPSPLNPFPPGYAEDISEDDV